MATPLLAALRRAHPEAMIDWAVGTAARPALQDHPALSRIIDTGPSANPANPIGGLIRMARILHAGHYDLAVVPDRSPWLSLTALLAGIPQRAGLNSAGRGFAYTIKVPIDPGQVRHEADIYLDLARVLQIDTAECWANLPPGMEAQATAQTLIEQAHLIDKPLIIVHPGGGVNAGMTMIQKRWPAERFAALADRAADRLHGHIMLIGVESDRPALAIFREAVQHPVIDWTDRLTLPTIGALAARATLYIGNDNGVAHVAAASGGKVLMIFGPSDPRRYSPFVPPNRARVAWREIVLPARGVNAGIPLDFNWDRDGVSVEEAWQAVLPLLS